MSKKPYYHQHEEAYRQIQARGMAGWANAKTIEDLGDPQTKEYLRRVVQTYFANPREKSALDVGCGTGTTAFVLSRMGFGEVVGVDISETAIVMARDLAAKQNLEISFRVADVLHLTELGQRFDLIYDSHCLHCIVHEKDRAEVLKGTRASLKKNGIFVLDTMVLFDGIIPQFPGLRFDADYILWHKSTDLEAYETVEKDGENWTAQRRIYPVEKIKSEVAAAGFEVLEETLDPQADGHPSMLRLVLKASTL